MVRLLNRGICPVTNFLSFLGTVTAPKTTPTNVAAAVTRSPAFGNLG